MFEETPLELIQKPRIDSTVIRLLNSFYPPIAQCYGEAYDGASNMSGHLHGLSACIQQCKELLFLLTALPTAPI